jgi:hypothetical protein
VTVPAEEIAIVSCLVEYGENGYAVTLRHKSPAGHGELGGLHTWELKYCVPLVSVVINEVSVPEKLSDLSVGTA